MVRDEPEKVKRDTAPKESQEPKVGLKKIMVKPLPEILDEIEDSIKAADEAAKNARQAAEEARQAGEKAATEAARVASEAISRVEQVAKNALQLAELLKLAITEANSALQKRLSGKQ